jgi:signal transduction histidine kinase
MSLSTDLIEDALRASGTQTGETSVSVALDALRHGAKDMERMLQGLTLLSRAYNGAVEPARAPLRLVLAGHLVISDASDLNETLIAVDPMVVRELLDAVASDDAAELRVRIQEGFALIEVAAPDLVAGGVSPLMALAASLTYGAGTAVETLAVRQVLIERHGGRVCVEGGRLEVWLPLADSAGPAGDAS